jgi:Ca2+-binding RTX toxin-like protein
VVDLAGNVGATANRAVTIDTSAPTAAVAIGAISTDSGASPSDFVTNDTRLVVSGTHGTLASSERIEVSADGGVTWADVTTSTATTWSYNDPATHAASFSYQVRVVDLAGNLGNTASQAVTIDTSAPTAAVAIGAISTDSGVSSSDFLTNDTSLTVSGTHGALATGEKIQVSVNGGANWADVTASTATTWSYTDPANHAASFTYQVRVVDLAGNVGATASHAVTIDTSAATVALTDITSSGSAVVLSGTTTEAGAVQILDGGAVVGNASASGSGAWSVSLSSLSSGSHALTVNITDAAGNIGSTSVEAVMGTSGANALSSGGGIDVLVGLGGADTLTGGGGKDLLIGGAGADRMAGGNGADIFRFDNLSEATGDHITDYGLGNDVVQLGYAGFNLANQAGTGAAKMVSVSGVGDIQGADVVRWTGSATAMNSAAEVNSLLASQGHTFSGGVLVLAYDAAGHAALYYDSNAAGGAAGTVTQLVSFDNLTTTSGFGSGDFLFV